MILHSYNAHGCKKDWQVLQEKDEKWNKKWKVTLWNLKQTLNMKPFFCVSMCSAILYAISSAADKVVKSLSHSFAKIQHTYKFVFKH